ncbi:hypothetical protein ACJMK2_042717 [Sinanodonta woodiana]|uniref:Tetratricopeptide repeat protein 33 n=1 Tax=Sinanodonta woodiana TaxID=1069815 RepID=A0ABD3W8A7_SINWO
MATQGNCKFVWKRKIGASVSKNSSKAFENEAKDDEDPSVASGDIDWLTAMPKRRVVQLEDTSLKAKRLTNEGTVLADAERYWEAIKKWDEASQYTPADEKIYEMKAQALIALNEPFQAVQAARKSHELNPLWWVAHQTLGRALISVGEVKMALRSFSKAVHLHPDDKELWEEDLLWAFSLINKKEQVTREKAQEEQKKQKKCNSLTIQELDAESGLDGANKSIQLYSSKGTNLSTERTEACNVKNIKRLPDNYVQMRDPG